MTDDLELADLLRRTLRARASMTPRVVGRRAAQQRPARRWATIAAAGVVAAGAAGVIVATTRPDPSSDTASSPTVPARGDGVLLTPPPDTPGLRVVTDDSVRPGGGYTTGVVLSPDGTVVIVQNDPGEFPTRGGSGWELGEVGDRRVATWTAGGARTYALESPCSNTAMLAATDDAAWSGELYDLVEATTIGSDGSMSIDLPDGWTSYGAGLMGPGFSYRFTIPVDGTPTTFTALQRFGTEVGATFRQTSASPVTVDGAPALVYGTDQPGVHFSAGTDSVSLSGPVDTETLLDVAGTLGRHDVTVDLDAAWDRYPPIEFTDCQRSITIAS